jgi:Raf kinase inhibitor-like YbhB/YbcL family protein
MVRRLVLTVAACLVAHSATALTLSSNDIHEGMMIPDAQVKAECGGLNQPPGLSWSGAPDGTKSFAVTMFDPDAGVSGLWHWVIIDIPSTVSSVPRAIGWRGLPASAMALPNDFQKIGYGGPCPPTGSRHRYVLTVWALPDDHLPFDRTAVGAHVEPYLKKHALASAAITATYGGN